MRKILFAISLLVSIAGCSLPRGAPLIDEIVKEGGAENPTFEVVEVTRASLPRVAAWPATGWSGHYTWLQAGGGARSSVLRAGDVLNLRIWDSDPNSLLLSPAAKVVPMTDLVVSTSGTVFVPYVGEVVVNGLTPDGARDTIQRELERVAPSAQVQLNSLPGINNSADLVRGVTKPGPVALPARDFTILSLLAQGGGIAPSLRNPLVRLIRDSKTYEIRADDLLSDAGRNIVVRGGDKVIVVEDDRHFVAIGASKAEKPVYFTQEHITLVEALSMVGGLNELRANLQGVLVLRDYPAGAVDVAGIKGPKLPQVVFTVDMSSADGLFAARSFEVNPGDTVMVTESPLVGTSQVVDLVLGGLLARSRLGY